MEELELEGRCMPEDTPTRSADEGAFGGVCFGDDNWNALRSIDILPDTASTIQDLNLASGFYGSTGWDGRWTERIGDDLIQINRTYTDGYSTTKKRGVVGHELGHALGIDDHYSSKYNGILMSAYTSTRGSAQYPQTHDIVHYRQLWG